MTDLILMALALVVYWLTMDREALLLLVIWSVSAFLFIEDPTWFAFYAVACGTGCVLSNTPFIIKCYIAQLLISLGCLCEWFAGGNFIFNWYAHMISFCYVMQLTGVTLGNIHFSWSGDISDRNFYFTLGRG